MLDPTNKDKDDLPLTIRAVFIIGPDKKLKLSLNYPASVGRNMDEIMRCVDALQLSAKHSVVGLSSPNHNKTTMLCYEMCKSTHSVIAMSSSCTKQPCSATWQNLQYLHCTTPLVSCS